MTPSWERWFHPQRRDAPCFELRYLLGGGIHMCPSSTLGLQDFETQRSVASPRLPHIRPLAHCPGRPSFLVPWRWPLSSNKAQTGWPGAAREHQAETMVGVSRLCKPAVTRSGGSPFLGELIGVSRSLTEGKRTAQRLGMSVECGDGQSPPHPLLEVHRDHTRVWGP